MTNEARSKILFFARIDKKCQNMNYKDSQTGLPPQSTSTGSYMNQLVQMVGSTVEDLIKVFVNQAAQVGPLDWICIS